jgi:hypothetical protein
MASRVIENYIWLPFRVASCGLNYATGGSIYETFCSRVWRSWALDHKPRHLWAALLVLIDSAFLPFDPDHCWKQFRLTANRQIKTKWSVSWLWQTF